MRRLVLPLLALLACAYPLLIYASIGHVAPHWLALLLATLALMRAAATRERSWLIAAAGAALLAGASATSGDHLPLKLYPALVNAVLLVVFAWSLRHPPAVIERLARLTEPALPPTGVAYTRGLTRVWCGFFIVNGVLALTTALWPSQAGGDEIWALYNGLIAYLLMGLLFAGEWLLRPHLRRRMEGAVFNNWLALAEAAARSRDTEFLRQVQGWRAVFAAQPGDAVILYFEDSWRFSCALYGAWHAGKTVYLPGDAQPATLQGLEALHSAVCRAGDLPGALPEPPQADPAADTDTALPALLPLDARATQLVVYTSGSSGQPQAIPKQLFQLDAEVHTLQATFGARLGPGTATYATVSHQHIYGLLFVVLWPLAAGRSLHCQRIRYPEELARQLKEQAPGSAVFVSSPAHLKRLPTDMPGGLDWRGARTALSAIFSSGGPLPPDAAEDTLRLLGQSPIEVYGSSETGGIAWRQRATQGDRWTPFAAVQWRIGGIDEDNLLAVHSPNLPDEQWFQTADRARALPANEGGGFVLQGRADRIVKIEEKRVSLSALETALLATGLLKEARALVLDGEDAAGPATTQASGKRAQLAIAAVPSAAGWALHDTQGKRSLNESLRTALLQNVERVALPRRWRYVRELPQNAQGKTTQANLLALFADAPARTNTGPTPSATVPLPAATATLPPARWLERGDTTALLALDMHAGLAAFDGHFDGAPILPGLAQLDWAARFGREGLAPLQTLSAASLGANFSRIEVLKFQQPILPDMQVELRLSWKAAPDGGGTLDFSYRGMQGPDAMDGVVHSSGRLVYAAPKKAKKDD